MKPFNNFSGIAFTGKYYPYFIDYSVKGDVLNEDMSEFRRQRLPILENYTRLYLDAYDSEAEKKIMEMNTNMAPICGKMLSKNTI
jgi:hypothetical protein